MNVIDKTKELGLGPEDCVVVAGGAMAARGLKETADVDLVVSETVYEILKQRGWIEEDHDGMKMLIHDVYEAFTDWDSPKGKPNITDVLADSEFIDGVAVASLPRVLAWKKRMNRPKDKADIEKIEVYLATS